MKILFPYCFAIIMVGIAACEEEFDYKNKVADDLGTQLVVNAWITSNPEPQTVWLKKLVAVTDEGTTNPPVSGALVTLKNPNGTWLLNEVTSGEYVTDSTWRVDPNTTTELSIVWEGEQYQASAFMKKAEDFEPFKAYSAEELGIQVDARAKDWPVIPFLTNQFGYSDPARWELRFFINNPNLPPIDTSQSEVFFTHPNLETDGLLSLESIDYKIVPDSTSMILSKFSLSDEGYEYYRSVLKETDWSGDLYSTIPGNVPSNISNGGLGFFGASHVITKRTILSVR